MEGFVPSLHVGVGVLGGTESGHAQGQDDQPTVRGSRFPRLALLTGREAASILAATVLTLSGSKGLLINGSVCGL